MSDLNESQDEFASIGEQNQAPETPEVPSKYKDKTPEELLKIVLDQERFIGRQAEEVGFARKIAEESLKRQSVAPVQPQESEDDLDEVDFFTDPKKAINKAVSQHPEVVQARKMALEMRKTQAQREIKQAHPDVDQVVSDPEFQQWVMSSKARTMLYQTAEREMDAEAANELLDNYKMRKASNRTPESTVAQSVNKANQQSLKAAQVDSGTGYETMGKKPIRMADIRDLMRKDQKRFDDMFPEIAEAFVSGRVEK